MPKISVILPTWNEKDNVPALIRNIHACLNGCSHEIVVVDDNSPDGTYTAVRRLNDPRVKTVLRTNAKGLAKSIRCGLEAAGGEVLIVMDSDFNHHPRYLPSLLEAIQAHDCVVASRFLPGGKMNHPVRHLLSWLFNRYVVFLTRGRISDNLYGFFAIKRRVLEQCPYEKIFFGFGDYFIRFVYYLQKNGADIHQIPAVNGPRLAGQGNRRLFQTAWQYWLALHSFVLKERFNIHVYGN